MFNKIVLAGGSGFLGQVLADYYKEKAKEIIILSRRKLNSTPPVKYEVWDGKTVGKWTKHLEDCDLLINLSGKNVNCRYTEKNKRKIIQSRVEPTTILGNVISGMNNPPKAWINLASATIYRHAEDYSQDELNGEIGSGFSIDVCKAWERSFWQAQTPSTKKILLRVGIVFGRRDGVIPRLKNLVMLGMGGQQGNGRQFVSWIHEQDFARVTEWVFYNGHDGDIYNCTAPQAIRNKDLMQLIRRSYGVPFGLPTSQWLLEIGAAIIGTETELILKSRWVYPKYLLDKGFEFQFPKAEYAVNEILSTRV